MLKSIILIICGIALYSVSNAYNVGKGCCDGMGGAMYCDSSAGRLVCNNGEYSACYCTRHAVMDLHALQGCCLWHGGVANMDANPNAMGEVYCADGTYSLICTLEKESDEIRAY